MDDVPLYDEQYLHDVAVATECLKLGYGRVEEHIRKVAVQATAVEMWKKREQGKPVTDAYIKLRAGYQLLTLLKSDRQEMQRREMLRESFTSPVNPVILKSKLKSNAQKPPPPQMLRKCLTPPNQYPARPSLPENGVMAHELVDKCLRGDEPELLRMIAEGKTDGEMAIALGRSKPAIRGACYRLRQKIRGYFEGTYDEG